MVLINCPSFLNTTETRNPIPEWFYWLTYFNKRTRTQDADQRTWEWRRVLKIKNDSGGGGVSDPKTTLTIQSSNSLFKLKRDHNREDLLWPQWARPGSRSLIKFGAHIFKERRTVVNKRELMCIHWQASARAFIYTLRLALQIQWVLNEACGQMENQGHSIILLHLWAPDFLL